VYIYIYVHIYIYICIYIYTHIFICIYIYIFTYIYKYIRIHTNSHTHTHTHTYIHAYTYIYTHTHTYTFTLHLSICIYVHIYAVASKLHGCVGADVKLVINTAVASALRRAHSAHALLPGGGKDSAEGWVVEASDLASAANNVKPSGFRFFAVFFLCAFACMWISVFS